MNLTNIRPLYDRAIIKEKATLKAILKIIILEVKKTKSTLTTKLLKAQ